MFPDSAKLYIAGIEDAQYKAEKLGFWDHLLGFNFSPIRECAIQAPPRRTCKRRGRQCGVRGLREEATPDHLLKLLLLSRLSLFVARWSPILPQCSHQHSCPPSYYFHSLRASPSLLHWPMPQQFLLNFFPAQDEYLKRLKPSDLLRAHISVQRHLPRSSHDWLCIEERQAGRSKSILIMQVEWLVNRVQAKGWRWFVLCNSLHVRLLEEDTRKRTNTCTQLPRIKCT